MEGLTTAAGIVLQLGANEAYNQNSEFIEIEHILLGILKIEDIIEPDEELLLEIDNMEWEKVVQEITNFKKFLKGLRINCKNIRRRLRKILVEHMEEEKVFSGHVSEKCKKLFRLAGELAGNGRIDLFHLTSAILMTESITIDMVFEEFFLDRETMGIKISKEVRNAGESGSYKI
jgi:hypothetical protein